MKTRYLKAYQHTYYNKNCFPEQRELLACKRCSNDRAYADNWRKIKLIEPVKCEYCQKEIK